MLIILLPLTVFLVGIIMGYVGNRRGYDSFNFEALTMACLIIGGFFLLVSLILLPIQRNSTSADIEAHKAIGRTMVETRRHEISELERIGLTQDVLETNMKLAKAKYYANSPWFGIYYPKKVIDVEEVY